VAVVTFHRHLSRGFRIIHYFLQFANPLIS
jgi:hypothetical protein